MVIIEMQVLNGEGFEKRILYNVLLKHIQYQNTGSLEYTPQTLTEEPEIKKAFEIANIAGMSQEELEAQFKRHDFIYLQKNSIEFALKQGMEQGRKQKAIEVAKALLDLGIDLEHISKAI